MIENFAKLCIERGGDVVPLIVDCDQTKGTGLTNCSIFKDDDGSIFVNLRNVEYTFFHAEKEKFGHPWGPVVYVHPENDWKLRTNNFLGVMNSDVDDFKFWSKVDTTKLDVEPLWEFVGLEDARIVRWDGKLFITGVRRDTTDNGEGRMELSEIELVGDKFTEVSRQRIPIPGAGYSYCEKNWMPVIDMPYTYVKWCSPVEVVEYDPETKKTKTIFLGKKDKDLDFDFRGGSQVIPFGEYRIAFCHVTNLFRNENVRKNCTYRHRIIVFDKDWNLIKYTDEFDFMGAHVEFAVGACVHEDQVLVTFGFSDNTSFLLKIPSDYLKEFIGI